MAAEIPIGHIFDHGGSQTNPRFAAYAAVRDRIGHTVLKPGDKVSIKGVDIQVLTAGGKLIHKKGAPNPLCATNKQAAELPSDVEDNNSIGLLIRSGKFRMLDLADLEAHHTHDLVCPANIIGHVSVYNVNVHGQFKGSAPELAGVLEAPVIIQANGSRKGADAQSWPVLKAAPGLKDIWQVVLALATDFPRPWNDPSTANRERKRMVRLLIDDNYHSKGDQVQLDMRFRGGASKTLILWPADIYTLYPPHPTTMR